MQHLLTGNQMSLVYCDLPAVWLHFCTLRTQAGVSDYLEPSGHDLSLGHVCKIIP